MRLFIYIFSISGLGLAAFFLTRSVISPPPATAASEQADATRTEITDLEFEGPSGGDFPGPEPFSPAHHGHGGVVDCLVVPLEGSIFVDAQFELAHINAIPFLWTISVFDFSEGRRGELLHVRRYDDQVGMIPAGGTIRPRFTEWIEMAPGSYHVWVQALEIPPGGIDDLDSQAGGSDSEAEMIRNPWTLVGAGGIVTVP